MVNLIFSTNKRPRKIFFSLSLLGGMVFLQNLAVFLLAMDMCKPEYYGYASSWCKFCINLYACSRCSLSMVYTNYKVNWNYWFFFWSLHIRQYISKVRRKLACIKQKLIHSFSISLSLSYSNVLYSAYI